MTDKVMIKTKIIIAAASLALLGAACAPGQVSRSGDGGVWLTTDKGENWGQKVLIYADRTSSKTIADIVAQKLIFSPKDNRKILAVSPDTGLWVSWNGGNNWDASLAAGNVADAAISPDNPRVWYAAVGRVIAKTENEGGGWKAIFTTDQEKHNISALALLPSKPAIIYAGTNRGDILFSEDYGRSWRTITRLPGAVKKLAVHPAGNNIIYAGLDGAGLAQSFDSGQNWKVLNQELAQFPGAGNFRDFALTPTGIIYAYGNGLLRSLDQGEHWVSLPLISPDQDTSIYSLAANPQNPLEIYYGTRSTFYHSADGGFNWIPRSLPTTKTPLAILINPEDPAMIYLGVGKVK